uniref:NmrA-like domain-containing protein n=1 Tax=Bionectria ochroleuca TaxID=29856 RepID=A0A8H7K6X3_BIOOC
MAAQKIKVAVTGATGETGVSIIKALLESEEFAVTAYVRPSSTEKPQLQGFKEKKVPIIPLDLEAASLEEIVKAFQGQDIIISGVMPHTSDIEKKLATAAKEVGVKRFIPSFFAPLAPQRG